MVLVNSRPVASELRQPGRRLRWDKGLKNQPDESTPVILGLKPHSLLRCPEGPPAPGPADTGPPCPISTLDWCDLVSLRVFEIEQNF